MNKKLMLFFIIGIFIFSLASVSATLKTYDDNTKTVTLKSNILFVPTGDIATVQLLTPLNYKVGLGEQYVAEMKVSGFKDYNDFIQQMNFYDKKNGMAKINRDFDFRKREIIQVSVDDYTYSNQTSINGTIETISTITGSHLENRETWTKLKQVDFKKNDILFIRMYTNVQQGDKVEWIPTIAGVEVPEWATWTADLNTNLISYYKLDETSGTIVIDSVGSNDGTNNGATINVAGKVGTAYDFEFGDSDYIDLPLTSTSGDYTFSFWVKLESTGITHTIFDTTTGRLVIQLDTSSNRVRVYDGVAFRDFSYTFSTATWYNIVILLDGTGSSSEVYVNDVSLGTDSYSSKNIGGTDVVFGKSIDNIEYFDGIMDEVGIWDRVLTSTEVTQLYNSGDGISYTNVFGTDPTVTPISPDNNTISTTSPVTQNFTCYGSDGENFTEMEFHVNGILNQTNSSGLNNTNYTFTTTLSEGNYNWTCIGYDDEANTGTFTARTYSVDTTPFIEFVSPTLDNASNLTVPYFPINISLTETYFENLTIDIYKGGVLNESVTFIDGTRFYNKTGCTCDTWTYNATVWTSTGQMNSTETRTLFIDVLDPSITITGPEDVSTYLNYGDSIYLNYSISDDHIDSCWFDYNSTNTSISCGGSSQAFNITTQTDIMVWANDTFGNIGSEYYSWNVPIIITSENYTSSILEGATSTFTINGITNGTSISIGNLSYNNEQNIGTIYTSGDTFIINKSLTSPVVTTDTNYTFFWKLTQAGSTISINSHNQTVLNFGIDDCSTYTNVLYNFTIVDEKTQVKLVPATQNTTGKVDLQITSLDGTDIANLSNLYSKINPYAVCLSNNFSGGESYLIDLQNQYGADEYATELYNIQQATISSSTLNQNITLYDLDNATSQVFTVTYRDSSFLPIKDVLVTVKRKYIDEGVFKTVESPLTDSNGKTIVHLELYNAIYTFQFIKNGIILSTFDNSQVTCTNLVLGQCDLVFNAVASTVSPTQYIYQDGMSYTLSYDNDTRTISLDFNIIDGTLSTLSINATALDGVSTDVCSSSLTSSSGIVSCIIPAQFTNGTALIKIYKDGEFVGQGTVNLNQSSKSIYGSNILFLSLFMFLTLLGVGISDSPMVTGMFMFIGALIGVGLNITESSGVIGPTATILWLLIAVILVVVKGAKRN